MSAPSEEPPAPRSLRAFVSKRRVSTFGLSRKEDKKGVLRRGKSVLKNVAGGVRKSVSVGEGLLARRDHDPHDVQPRECESATLLRVDNHVLADKKVQDALRSLDEDPDPPLNLSNISNVSTVSNPPNVQTKTRKTVRIDLPDHKPVEQPVSSCQATSSSSQQRSPEDNHKFGVRSMPVLPQLEARKEKLVGLENYLREKEQRNTSADPEHSVEKKDDADDTSPRVSIKSTHSDGVSQDSSTATHSGIRASYRKHSISDDFTPDDGGTSYTFHTRNIKTMSIVERSVAASVISAARQRSLAKKAKPPPPARPPHHRPHGGYCNPWDSALKESGMRTRGGSGSRTFFHKVAKDRRPPDEELAGLILLAGRPDFEEAAKALEEDKYALASHWIGHSTFFLQMRGLTVLTDPVWNMRLGPLGPKRLVPPPCEINDLPDKIDVVILSSACYDAFDKTAVQQLASRVSMWLVPLGVKVLLMGVGIDDAKIQELDWWQEFCRSGCTFVCTPAQHYSVRDDALWSSWVIHAPHHRVFFCGATGYRSVQRDTEDGDSYDYRNQFGGPSCPVFKEISRRYGACDTAFLPIGGYKPRVLMSGVQGDPIDMLSVHRDLRARRSIAHRWGTFSCAEEGLLDAVRMLEAGLLSGPVSEHEFCYVKHGRLHVS